MNDVEEWTGSNYIQLNEMYADWVEWRKKIMAWLSAVANPRSVNASTSECIPHYMQYNENVSNRTEA